MTVLDLGVRRLSWENLEPVEFDIFQVASSKNCLFLLEQKAPVKETTKVYAEVLAFAEKGALSLNCCLSARYYPSSYGLVFSVSLPCIFSGSKPYLRVIAIPIRAVGTNQNMRDIDLTLKCTI